jgi:hypothetical protein
MEKLHHTASVLLLFVLFIGLGSSCTTVEIKEEDVFDVKRTIDPSYFQNSEFDIEQISFTSGENLSLEGWFISHPLSRGTVLYFGGNGFLKETAYWIIKAVTEQKMNLLVFNYRGYGKNPGKPTISGLKADGLAAYNYLVNKKEIPPSRIIIHGHSLGSLVGGYVADKKPGAGLIMESPISDVNYYTKRMLPNFLKPFIHFKIDSTLLVESNIKRLSGTNLPLLLIVGKEDPVTPPEMAEKLFKTAPNRNKTLKILDKGGHNDLPERKDYQSIIDEFYRNTVKHSLTNIGK